MKRIIDQKYFTHTVYTANTMGIYVACPSCHGLAIVTADSQNAYLKCTKCSHTLSVDRTIYRYDVHNRCKSCEQYYRVDITDKKNQHFHSLHVACPHCGFIMSGNIHKTPLAYSYLGEIKHSCEPYFGLELWYLASFDSKAVWALNPQHLAFLIDYLDADLREKPLGNSLTKTQADHLPTFMKLAKNRKKIVKLLKELQLKTSNQ